MPVPPKVEHLAAEDLVFGAQLTEFAIQRAQPFGCDRQLGTERIGAGAARTRSLCQPRHPQPPGRDERGVAHKAGGAGGPPVDGAGTRGGRGGRALSRRRHPAGPAIRRS